MDRQTKVKYAQIYIFDFSKYAISLVTYLFFFYILQKDSVI